MDRIDEELAALGAILVEDRTLRRIIKRHRRLPGLGLQVPHAHCCSVPGAELAALLEPERPAVEAEKLPAHVCVFTGVRAALDAADADATSKAWRTIFHVRVHQELDALLARGTLTVAGIRDRINRIGQTEFDEVRYVLRQEDLLFPPIEDVPTYVEFVALFLELRHFAPRALARTFPTLDGAARVDATIALDLDAAALLAATRPPRAPARPIGERAETAPPVTRKRPLPSSFDARASRAARGARERGNRARAAILAFRAGEPAVARADLDELIARLSRALGDVATTGWADALLPVAQFAAAQRVLRFTAGARLLYDLQRACVDAERELQVVDAVTWGLSLGKVPIVRAVPATREVRVARHLHAAARKLARCELGSEEEREQLSRAVHVMVERANDNVRRMLRPKIEAALEEVELRPRQLPERVAQKKIVDELLDQAVAVGRLSLGNLRDAISHNELKLPDLRPGQLIGGDQLLHADRILAVSLDGVYRRGEIYLRFLQRVSSVLSGIALGRLLSLYVLLPIVGSFFVVEGLQHIIGPLTKLSGHHEPHLATRRAFALVAMFLFLLLHASWFRHVMGVAMRALGRGLRVVLIDTPRQLWRFPGVRPFCRWLLLPALPAGLAFLVLGGIPRFVIAGAFFAGTAAVINSRAAEELVSDWLLRSGRQLARRILPGLLQYLIEFFAWMIELTERLIYRVDEMLRFRPNESRFTVAIKGVLGVIWFVIAYVLRLYVNLFIEPTVNPIKHFPVVTVAAKLILPFIPQITSAIAGPVGTFVGPALGASFAAFTVLVMPGLAGFLAWELNGNWKLYRSTRPELVREVRIGHHGETVLALMRPGFHSGTIPKLNAKLRRAAAKDDEQRVARLKESLHHVEEAIWKFADRQLVAMLNEAPVFVPVDVAVAHVEIAANRIRIDLVCPSVSPAPATIAFELQSGWLIAGIPEHGWLDGLDADHRRIFELVLTGFYKMSGVDVVREQIEAILAGPDGVPAYDFAEDGLVVWPGPGFETEIVYDLRSGSPSGQVRGGAWAGEVPVLAGKAALFGREPLRWTTWSQTWEHLEFGMESRTLLSGPSLLAAAPREVMVA